MIKKNTSVPKVNDLSRRKFIQTAGLAATAFSILPRSVLGGKGFVAPSDTLYIAGIGVGGKGYSDLTSFSVSPKAIVSILCDVDDRRAERAKTTFPKAKYYKDYRKMLDAEHKHIDAVSVSTPDHMHTVQAMAAMQLGKHVYVQKPLTHDIFEARKLTEAATKYKVVTQMGNQGASGDGVRQMREWYNSGLIGDVHTVYCFTDRPVWPQGVPWPTTKSEIPKELDWELWLGTAPRKDYIDNLVPFNWRGWWDYGTGALGDMACHLVEAPYRILGLTHPNAVECSVGSVYVGEFRRGYFPESCPPSSHVIMTFPEKNGKPGIKLHWMDGGIQPERPDELGPNEKLGDGGNGVLLIGTKGKMMCGTYGRNPQLLPTSKTAEINIPQTIARVPQGDEPGHYLQWVDGCMAGYGKTELSSDFSLAGPLTEIILMGNLAIRSFDVRVPKPDSKEGQYDYPGRYVKLLWDGPNMKITNFDQANEFVKRKYSAGYSL